MSNTVTINSLDDVASQIQTAITRLTQLRPAMRPPGADPHILEATIADLQTTLDGLNKIVAATKNVI